MGKLGNQWLIVSAERTSKDFPSRRRQFPCFGAVAPEQEEDSDSLYFTDLFRHAVPLNAEYSPEKSGWRINEPVNEALNEVITEALNEAIKTRLALISLV